MSISTQYFDDISLVRLSGNLTANEILGSVIKFNRGQKFKEITARIVDASQLKNVSFQARDMKVFVAVDKSSFINNEDLTVLMISHNFEHTAIFQQYADMMSASPWEFIIVDSMEEALRRCESKQIDVERFKRHLSTHQ